MPPGDWPGWNLFESAPDPDPSTNDLSVSPGASGRLRSRRSRGDPSRINPGFAREEALRAGRWPLRRWA